MTETRNHRKRTRDNEQSPQDPLQTTESPPTKKRRVSTENKKPRGKDITKWSINELKRHLKQNGITFQLNRDKAYYIRLVTMRNNKPSSSPKTVNRVLTKNDSPQSPPLLNGSNDAPNTVHSPSISDNSNSSDSSNSPDFSTPRRPTPPLPSVLNREPFIKDTSSEEENESHKLSQTNLSQNKPRTVISPPQTQSAQFVTPQTFKSRIIMDKETPSYDETDEQLCINPLQFDVGLQRSNSSTFSANNNGVAQHKRTMDESMPQRRLGPFQDIASLGKMFKLKGYSMPRPTMPTMLKERSNYFTFLCVTVCILIMAMFVPYIIAAFVEAPFCNNKSDTISGRYAVFYDTIPLENIMQCTLCPYNATCNGGSAVCIDGYHLDENMTLCLPDKNDIAVAASRIAHEVNIILGKKLGDWECSMQDPNVSYQVSEGELESLTGYIAKEYYNAIVVKKKDDDVTETDNTKSADDTDDDNESIESVSVGNETSDEITKQDETVSESSDEAVFVAASWDYATTFILPNAYINVSNATLVYDDPTKTYKSLREIPNSMKCKAVLLYRHYRKHIYTDNAQSSIIAGFCALLIGVVIFIVIARRVSMDPDPLAVAAGNFVLQKLSQQQALHFSIDQFKLYTMRNHNISLKTWNKTVKYVNESPSVALIEEDIDGDVRMCWKWKAPVPYVPL